MSPTEVVKWCELVNSQEWMDGKQVGSRRRKTKGVFRCPGLRESLWSV